MMKQTKYNWILTFPGHWHTKEGYKLCTIERPAKYGYSWYKFKGREFEAKGSFQAQLRAEEFIEEDLNAFKRALNNMEC